jgi:hypothetical protein
MPNRINSTSDFYRQNQNDIFQDGKNDAGANSAGATVTASLAEGQISTTAEIDGDLRLIDSDLEALAQNPTANTNGNSNYSYSQAYFFRWLVRLGQIIGSRLPTLSNGRIPILLESVPLATDAARAANQLVANAILDTIETALSDLNTRSGTTGDSANPAGSEAAQLRAIGERLRVSAYSIGETATANPGTTWVPLASGAATSITIRNRASTSIDVRIAGGGAVLTLANNEDVALPVLSNSSEWEVRRSDTSNTQVSIRFLRYTA